MNVGFIGIGSMGSLLVDAFIGSGALKPSQITVSNRTFAKAICLADRHPGLKAVSSNREAVIDQDIVFLCIKPVEFKSVLDAIRDHLLPNQLVISITSPVLLEQLEDALPCKIAKVIPSITNFMCSGVSLCMYGSRMTDADIVKLNGLLAYISEPLQIDEAHTRIVSDLSSVGPAIMACLLQRFIDAAAEETGLPREQARLIASEMLLGTGQLLTTGGMSPEELQARVVVPGGITAQALALLNRELDNVFNRVIMATHAKYREDLEKVADILYGKEVNGP
ncbi:late competence protein ComER [Paenibacillus sacheonensis]|uniref:Pyrroline-5-carboxylate reductase n=1 Tax=Paenibacillus sacheonensis TaxID=742054 RepID=A0A7X4YN75_9BACL|nr:late competence protein ComER [Paenibacillus sacheonensis]MBM7565595.1 competence protein ComER [Paenibacillus sacheonensis]NBC69487.1 late competence protein ComER [Paenibacillus sacheonensis]